MFKEKYHKSLPFRFLSIMSAILLLGTLVISLVIVINEGSVQKDSLMSMGKSFASFIAKLSQDYLIMKNEIQLDTIVNDANKDENIAYAIVRDEQGTPLTSRYASVNYRLPIVRSTLLGLSNENDLLEDIKVIRNKVPVIEVSIPIMSGIKNIGTVTIGVSEYKMRQAMFKTILFVILFNLGIAFVLGGGLFIASKKIIFDPIIELVHASSRLAKGDLSSKAEINTTGEVKTLVDSFNEMVQNLEKVTVSRDYMDNIVRSMINTLIVVTPDNKIMSANAAACRLLKYDEKELIDRPFEIVFGEEESNISPMMINLLYNDYLDNLEGIYKTKDGRKVPVLLSISVMRDGNHLIRGMIYVAQDITERKQVEMALKESEKNLRYLSSQLLTSQETERKRIATELHDGLGQALMVIKMRLRAIEKRLSLDDSQKEYGDLLKYVDEVIENVRRLSRDLMPSSLDNLGLQAALRYLFEEFSKYTEIRISVEMDDINDLFSPKEQIIVYRIFQETLTNIAKHAHATQVSVAIKKKSDGISFCLQDNGRGFDVQESLSRDSRERGLGLATMEERVRMLGGSLEMWSQRGMGTRLSFVVPVQEQN
jgi:PAS domain S-box-containing protein